VPLQPPSAGLSNFGVVESGVLYRGALPGVDRDKGEDGYAVLMNEYRIATIVDLMNEPIDHWIMQRRHDCERMTPLQRKVVRYVSLPAYEPMPRQSTLVAFLSIVENPANRPVFVHCADGANRTGAMVAGFRVVADHWQAVDARAEMDNFGVLPLWRGVNTRFIEDVTRDWEAIQREVSSAGQPEAIGVRCDEWANRDK
jgi:hypothetical protein